MRWSDDVGSPLRVLIAMRSRLTSDALTSLIDHAGWLTVIGRAATADAVIALADSQQPDVILLDLALPGISGAQLLQRTQPIGLVVLSAGRDAAIQQAGVDAAVRWSNGSLVLIDALRSAGTRYRSGPMCRRSADPDVAIPAEPLTPREFEVLSLLADGLSNLAIAEALAISIVTVRFHVQQIRAKLGVTTRAAAVAEARRRGLFTAH